MDFEAARARLVEHLGPEIKDQRVLAAMARIKRLGAYKYLFCIVTPKMQDTGGG